MSGFNGRPRLRSTLPAHGDGHRHRAVMPDDTLHARCTAFSAGGRESGALSVSGFASAACHRPRSCPVCRPACCRVCWRGLLELGATQLRRDLFALVPRHVSRPRVGRSVRRRSARRPLPDHCRGARGGRGPPSRSRLVSQEVPGDPRRHHRRRSPGDCIVAALPGRWQPSGCDRVRLDGADTVRREARSGPSGRRAPLCRNGRTLRAVRRRARTRRGTTSPPSREPSGARRNRDRSSIPPREQGAVGWRGLVRGPAPRRLEDRVRCRRRDRTRHRRSSRHGLDPGDDQCPAQLGRPRLGCVQRGIGGVGQTDDSCQGDRCAGHRRCRGPDDHVRYCRSPPASVASPRRAGPKCSTLRTAP